jgi:asparagine synthase (glutamine-hydrolysing)
MLKSWASDLLQEDNIKDEGFLDSKIIKAVWDDHISGKANYSNQLWSVLMFQAWLARWCR